MDTSSRAAINRLSHLKITYTRSSTASRVPFMLRLDKARLTFTPYNIKCARAVRLSHLQFDRGQRNVENGTSRGATIRPFVSRETITSVHLTIHCGSRSVVERSAHTGP
ncbi:unnamed protein product [Pieris brassicae]|uniref:Uncharacterized protein n=1 Tax=Pieris brassicae TaxID=7116 RepID=A0A9P0TIJ1_PIEBR|nr:unnamed protein product [Pieris brassicae]